nr:MAG TPA: hypothetical protein [Caudoviricetes sp.]
MELYRELLHFLCHNMIKSKKRHLSNVFALCSLMACFICKVITLIDHSYVASTFLDI